MASLRAGATPLMGIACVLSLAGCVDMYTDKAPTAADRWRGVTSAGGAEHPGCGPFAMDVGLYQDPVFLWQTVSGRAHPTTAATTKTDEVVDDFTSWWLEGYMTADNFVEFESRQQRPVFLGARPYSVWRGTQANDRIMLVESGSPCGREVVLTRG